MCKYVHFWHHLEHISGHVYGGNMPLYKPEVMYILVWNSVHNTLHNTCRVPIQHHIWGVISPQRAYMGYGVCVVYHHTGLPCNTTCAHQKQVYSGDLEPRKYLGIRGIHSVLSPGTCCVPPDGGRTKGTGASYARCKGIIRRWYS